MRRIRNGSTQAGYSPNSNSDKLNCAVSSARTISLAATNPTPPAFALPRICEIVTYGPVANRSHKSYSGPGPSSCSGLVLEALAIALKSAPKQKTSGEPLKTTTVADSSHADKTLLHSATS